MGLISRVSSRTYRYENMTILSKTQFSTTILLFSTLLPISNTQLSEKGVTYASKCEACKYMSKELEHRLKETGKNKEKIEIGRFSTTKSKPQKVVDYSRSELRLIESLHGDTETEVKGVCDRILEYNMHKERTGSLRFAKGESQTMGTLKGLVDKGVKVDLGIPLDLWDEPSAEVTQMKKQCETILEAFEDDIEEWYFDKIHFGKSLEEYLCRGKVLKNKDLGCLDEEWDGSQLVESLQGEEAGNEADGEDGGRKTEL